MNDFWKQLPSSHNPDITPTADQLLKLETYWQNIFIVARAEFSKHGRPGVNSVKALASRAVKLLADEAAYHRLNKAVILSGHRVASEHLSLLVQQWEQIDNLRASLPVGHEDRPDLPVVLPPQDVAYEAAAAELDTLKVLLIRSRRDAQSTGKAGLLRTAEVVDQFHISKTSMMRMQKNGLISPSGKAGTGKTASLLWSPDALKQAGIQEKK